MSNEYNIDSAVTGKTVYNTSQNGNDLEINNAVTGSKAFIVKNFSGGTGGVSSVNGKTGAVVLHSVDIIPVDGGTVSGGTATFTNISGGTSYFCGTIDLLTVSSVENSPSESQIIFLSGATATATNFPATLMWINGSSPTCEANSTYCISIQNNLAVCGKFSEVE